MNFNIDWTITYRAFISYFYGLMIIAPLYIIGIILCSIPSKDISNNELRKTNRLMFLYPFLISLIIVFNPVVISVMGKFVEIIPRVKRIFWILPISIVIAYTFTNVLFKLKSNIIKIIICVIIFGSLAIKGTDPLSKITVTDNIYKIDSKIIDVDTIINNDFPDENPVIVYSDYDLLQIREYDPSLICAIGRYELWGWIPDGDTNSPEYQEYVLNNGTYGEIIALKERFHINIPKEDYLRALNELNVNYIIVQSSLNQDYYDNDNFEIIAETQDYIIYKFK